MARGLAALSGNAPHSRRCSRSLTIAGRRGESYTRRVVNCILVELTDGNLQAYAYPDEETAATWYRECRDEWNEGRNVIFHLPQRAHGPSTVMHFPDDVAHLELTTREALGTRGVEYREAVTFG
ncbi:MAG: hypothetical protein QOH16_3901 [Gaiellaceae bacterium]|nr:hypothetical protein [Gaiellaceae bacterium]